MRPNFFYGNAFTVLFFNGIINLLSIDIDRVDLRSDTQRVKKSPIEDIINYYYCLKLWNDSNIKDNVLTNKP